MRVFPNSWVLPGGHIDFGESLEEGVIRELSEETGINILRHLDGSLMYKNKLVFLQPFFAFESSIPGGFQIDENNKKSIDYNSCPLGHLIIYFFVQLSVPY